MCKIDPIKLRTSVHLVSFIMLHLTISRKADTQMTSKKEREEEERKGGRRERGRERGRKGRTAEEGRKAAGGALQPGDMSARSSEDGRDGTCLFSHQAAEHQPLWMPESFVFLWPCFHFLFSRPFLSSNLGFILPVGVPCCQTKHYSFNCYSSDFLLLQRLQPTRFVCPWDSLGKNTRVGGHFLFQGIFLTQGSNPGLPHHGQILYHLRH